VSKLNYLPLVAVLAARAAAADPTSGVDGALFRSAYDAGGVFSLEGARLLPKRDLSFALLVSYARAPLTLNVPGIGDAGSDRILNYLVTFDMAFGMSLSDRVAIGIDAAGYRTATGSGYGVRGRYTMGGQIAKPSTGLISLRPLSNLDPSAPPGSSGYLGDELAGPLDARFGLKLALVQRPLWALTAVGSVVLPFGDDQMLLGDANLVFEPRLAFEWRRDRVHATRLVVNLGARIRERTVLQAYDPMTTGQTPADARAVLDVGSELLSGVGGVYELTPRLSASGELVAFTPLPDALSWGDCRLYSGARCTSLQASDYAAGAHHGDLAVQVTGGLMIRVTPAVAADLMVGTSLTGARGDQVRVTTGIVWSPQPGGRMAAGLADRDGDGIPDAIDQCPDEPEDKDGFQDEDGCPDPDNDGDGIPDVVDKCPNEPEDKDGFQDADGCPDPDNDGDGIPDALDKCPNEPEDKDGFQDEDGCPDDDNDGDGIPDAVDKCPNDPETVNGFEDEDGCPDVRGTAGPEERADRIDLKGVQVTFARGALTAPSRQLLGQVATLIKNRRLAIRIEVHVALGTRSTSPGQIAAQKRRDKALAQQRAKLIADYLVSQGVAAPQLQAVGIGSDRPLGTAAPTDPVNERVDFIKAQQGGSP
jgi:outer membrane protein OmpA-like peptidoglycan-associated protein